MQIGSVSGGYADPTTTGRPSENLAGVGPPKAGGVDPAGVAPPALPAALHEILRRYDVTDISPGELSEMIQKLYEAGAISEAELQQLAAIRLDLEAEGIDVDESIDLLEFYAERIEEVQRRFGEEDDPTAGRPQLGPLLGRLDWVEKFALIQSGAAGAGVDLEV